MPLAGAALCVNAQLLSRSYIKIGCSACLRPRPKKKKVGCKDHRRPHFRPRATDITRGTPPSSGGKTRSPCCITSSARMLVFSERIFDTSLGRDPHNCFWKPRRRRSETSTPLRETCLRPPQGAPQANQVEETRDKDCRPGAQSAPCAVVFSHLVARLQSLSCESARGWGELWILLRYVTAWSVQKIRGLRSSIRVNSRGCLLLPLSTMCAAARVGEASLMK